MNGSDNSAGNDWILGICSVVFDLLQGQKLEDCFPQNALSEDEANDVAFHSFPDSMSMELHSRSSVRDSTFFFRIRRRGEINREQSQKTSEQSSERQQGSQYDAAAFLYGWDSAYEGEHRDVVFVFCRQRSDERLKRGGEQKSVVVLSTQPYSGVLTPLSQHAGPLYFNNGRAALQEVYQEVQAWEPPSPGLRGIVMVGAVTLPAQVPAPATLPAAPPSSSANPEDLEHPLAPLPVVRQANGCDTIQGTFFEADVWSTLQEVVERAWVLWELMILAQPLLVLAPSPGVCSAAVAALVALITPLPYSADFRPYFTIHDPDFEHLASQQLPSNTNSLPRLLGVTNLFFLKALPTWPNVLSTGTRPSTSNGQSAVNGSAGTAGPDSVGAAAAKQGASRLQRLNIAVRKRSAGAQVLLSEHVQALWHTYKPLTRPDRSLLERLLRPTSQDAPGRSSRLAAANSAALRQHFGELTCAFLAPFAAFWQPTPPPPGNGPVPVQGPPHLPPFSHTEFLDSLVHATFPPVLLDRFANQGALVALYRRFLESPNFSAWFERQRAAAWGWQAAEWAAAAAARGEGADLRGLDEVQIVEAFFELERTLEAALAAARLPKAPPQAVARVAALRRGLGAVYEAMPRDLQQTILSSPVRAALLQSLSLHIRVPGQPARNRLPERRTL